MLKPSKTNWLHAIVVEGAEQRHGSQTLMLKLGPRVLHLASAKSFAKIAPETEWRKKCTRNSLHGTVSTKPPWVSFRWSIACEMAGCWYYRGQVCSLHNPWWQCVERRSLQASKVQANKAHFKIWVRYHQRMEQRKKWQATAQLLGMLWWCVGVWEPTRRTRENRGTVNAISVMFDQDTRTAVIND